MNILVFAEQIDGSFKKSTFEAVSYASQIAQAHNGNVTAVVPGNVADDKLAELALYGANKIVSVKHDNLNGFNAETYTKVICNVASAEGSSIVVISNTYSGKSLAPRVAARLKAGIASGVI